jgi:hypothetical protein
MTKVKEKSLTAVCIAFIEKPIDPTMVIGHIKEVNS